MHNVTDSWIYLILAASPVRGKEPSIATANNIDTLLGATESSEIVQPPENIQDKVHFIFNNISQATLSQKVSVMIFLVIRYKLVLINFTAFTVTLKNFIT